MKRTTVPFLFATALLVGLMAASVAADPWFSFGRRGERGSRNIATEEREVPPFDKIRLKCSADLIVTIGEPASLTVTTDDNLLDNIITEVYSRKTLLVDSEGSYSSRRGVLVEITVPELSMVEVDGSGDVEILGLKTDVFEVEVDGSGDVDLAGEIKELGITVRGSGDITADDLVSEDIVIESSGSGDVELRGRTEILDINLRGSGEINARRLKAVDAEVTVRGSGDVKVYAENRLDGAVYGSGDIDVYGDPKDFDRHVSGSGDISRR